MPTVVFEKSGFFTPSEYGLEAGDVVDAIAVGSGGGGGSGYVVYGRYVVTSSNVNTAVPVTVGAAVGADQNGQISSFGSAVSANGGSRGDTRGEGGAGQSKGGNGSGTAYGSGGGGAGGFYAGVPQLPNASNGGNGVGNSGGGGGSHGVPGSDGVYLVIQNEGLSLGGAPNGGTYQNKGGDGGPGSGVVIVCWD